MLVQFSVNNFRSINDTVTFSMNAGSGIDGKHRFQTGDHLLLNSAVIYGANASGKSNVLRAIGFMRHLVLNVDNISQPDDILPHEPFRLSTETEEASSYFEIIFFLNTVKYRYGFEADSTTVYAEWLYHYEQTEEICLFNRDIDENSHYVNAEKFKEGIDLQVPDNHLLLWLCVQNHGEISQKIVQWFDALNFVHSLENEAYFHLVLKWIKNTNTKTELIKLIKAAGLGIEDIVIEENDVTQDFMNSEPFFEEIKQRIINEGGNLSSIKLRTRYTKFNAENQPVGTVLFDLNEEESQGTKEFFALCALILDALERGKIVLIDQFDACLHPMLSSYFIELFNNKTLNKHNAQLIFATHNTNLLSIPDLLERDQIWFTEKDRYGNTELYSLLEFKKSNASDNRESCYLQGRYGAIPYLGEA
jgi:AAA15 family ATPase/GTPase